VARWWNGLTGPDRRDIWLTATGTGWPVRARHGEQEVHHDVERDYQAHALVDRLRATAPGEWKNITKLVRRPGTQQG